MLRAAYRVPPDRVRAGLLALLGLPGLVVEDEELVLRALAGHARGLDFADALHHAASARAAGFATFDRALVARGAELSLLPPLVEPG